MMSQSFASLARTTSLSSCELDDDDDGDGTPDELEGTSLGESEDNATPLILIGSIVILLLVVFFIRVRGGGPKTLGEIDERML